MIDPGPQPSLLFFWLLWCFWSTISRPSEQLKVFTAPLAGLSLASQWFFILFATLIVNRTLIGDYQTYAWDSISLIGSHSLSNLIYYGLLTVGLGFHFCFGCQSLQEKGQATSLVRLALCRFARAPFITVFAAFTLPDQGSYQLLPALPFAMILFALWFNKGKQQGTRASLLGSPSSHHVDFLSLSGQFFCRS